MSVKIYYIYDYNLSRTFDKREFKATKFGPRYFNKYSDIWEETNEFEFVSKQDHDSIVAAKDADIKEQCLINQAGQERELKLINKIKRLEDALGFYADKANYSMGDSYKTFDRLENDTEYIVCHGGRYDNIGGKRARQALADNCICGEINARNCPEHQGEVE